MVELEVSTQSIARYLGLDSYTYIIIHQKNDKIELEGFEIQNKNRELGLWKIHH